MAEVKKRTTSKTRKGTLDEHVKEIALRVLRVTGAALAIWLLGWFNFHYCWVLIGLGTYMTWKWKKIEKKKRMESLREATEDEKGTLMQVHNLPSWVFFPDTQRAEWLNQIIGQIWPFLNKMVKKIMKEKVEPEIQKQLPSMLKSLYFEQISLGTKSLKIGGIKVYTREVHRTEVIIDMDVIYAGDADVSVKLKGISAGISDLQVRGKLRVELKPLLPVSPLVGGISVYFMDCPEIDFDLTNLLNVLDVPGLSDILRCAVRETVCSFMVLPNRINIPLSDDERVESLKYPLPDGILHVNVIEAADLVARDTNIFSKDSSDPYVVIKVGSKSFRTKTIDESLYPVWNETFESFVDTLEGTKVYFKIFDADAGGKDEFLGSADIDLETVARQGTADMWLPLHRVKSGKVHVRCTWFHFSDNKDDLMEPKGDNDLSVAALFVKLDSGEKLPETDPVKGTSNPVCNITVGNVCKKSRVIENTSKPVWEELFRFAIHNPKFQEMDITVRDDEEDKTIGKLDFSVNRLLQQPNMRLKQPFTLKNAAASSKLHLILELKALVTKSPPKEEKKESIDDSNENQLRRRNVSKYPEAEARIWYDATKNKLRCSITGVRCNPDNVKEQELKVKLCLLPDKTAAGLRETKGFTLNSNVDEAFSYFISYDEACDRKLQIELELAGNNQTLGKVVLDLSKENLVNTESKWYKLQESHE